MTSLRKVLVIGSGGREHALALRLLESPSVAEVCVCPGNAGVSAAPDLAGNKKLRAVRGEPLEVARRERPDLVVVGPENPLVGGLVDDLTREGFLCFGPTRRAARLEGSKAFMKEFASRHGIRTARYCVVTDAAELDRGLADFSAPPVVKADGLCAGKGVVVADSWDEARAAAADMLSGARFGDAGRTVVLEERIAGVEASIHAISDGERFVVLPAAQDHKRIGEGDVGPNTGGMGTYAPAPVVDAALSRRIESGIIAPTIRGMAQEGNPFRGALFAGLMLPPAPNSEPVLIEYNVRFGDPETQVLVAVLDGDFAEACAQAAAGALDPATLRVSPRHAVCVVLAAAGYPQKPRLGDAIEGLAAAEQLPGVRVYHAGTSSEAGRIVTAGGRVLGVTAEGTTLAEAHARAYEGVASVGFDGMQFRRDIARQALTRLP